MLISIMLFVVPLLYMAARVLWAVFFRKFHKTKFRFFGVVISLVAAFVFAFLTKAILSSAAVRISLGDPSLDKLFTEAPLFRETVLGLVSSLLTPALFLVYFMIFDLISWIVYLIYFLIKKKSGKMPVESKKPLSIVSTVAFALGNALIVVFVWMLPIGTYMNVVPAALSCFTETDIMKEEDKAVYESIVTDYVDPINDNLLVNACRFAGGSALSDVMTTFEVNGTYIGSIKEVGIISEFLGNLIGLTQQYYEEYGEREIETFDRLYENIESSNALPILLSGALHQATDSWLEGDDFFGIWMEDISFDERRIFDGFIEKSVLILNEDTENHDPDLITRDMETTFSMFKILINRGVFANATEDDDLLVRLAKDGTVGDLIVVLEQNESMSALIPEVTNIGMNAIGSTLGFSSDGSAEYSEMMDNIATELNTVKQMDVDEQQPAVEALLYEEFEKEGMIVEDSVVQNYADRMVEDLVRNDSDEEITSNDVLIFFSENSYEASQNAPAA